jgi:hypothetical protein
MLKVSHPKVSLLYLAIRMPILFSQLLQAFIKKAGGGWLPIRAICALKDGHFLNKSAPSMFPKMFHIRTASAILALSA